ncbi:MULTISPECIES: DNA polymerase III subunit alpha [unclassified Leeuwenhoekiella]|uniref:DNA polymerase III subunit alpha n=1 Tax=unclassified Leeuwenhoekiella TaxID=2615029 RepID=UPI000C4D00CE|nr:MULTISPECIES: DNA polymerase III subunit alpha [unclassified Leeuwenhoekiella]MBA82755.1 DNA polymerase III subunit alpha [Leeuwenhoekiella sp.]|tara:strand:- start:67 stop:3090 length:3024 start_codon:yes stop_codon:yes gene_type:complete
MYLNCHSYYSLRYGTLSEIELLDLAVDFKQECIALTDINNTSAGLNFVRRAKEKNIKPVLGIDFRNGNQQCYVSLARNNEGYLELNNFLSKHLHDKTNFPEQAPAFQNAITIYTFERALELDKETFAKTEYIGVGINDLNRLRFSKYSTYKEKLVLLLPVSFVTKKDFNTHRLLRAIDTNTLLSKLPVEEQGSPQERMFPPEKINALFADHPYILENTKKLLESCTIDFDFSPGRPSQNLKTVYGNTEKDFKKLKELCDKGLKERYKTINDAIITRLKKELSLIKKQNFVSFFLINWKIIEYARSKNYFYVGRGSGANSIVAYLLRITDVDPIELDLYFERFMNEYRVNPPDFDIDFSTWDREDVTAFIFREFSKNGQAALLGSYVTFQHSGAVRELGKVFGMPKHEIDKLSSGNYSFNSLDALAKLTLKYASCLHERPNYLSIHAGGILISDKPIHYFSATHLPPKDFPTVQFDMHIAEDVGLFKFDILGQRGLGKIKDAIEVIKQNQPDAVLLDIHDTKSLFEDEKINAMIARAECIGCFYVESPAMRMLLKKLEVDNYHTLVAASSIIRPGVAKSSMMREYILRHRNPEKRKEAHPVLWEIMPDTYGIMVYQEDVIKVAHHYAKLNLGEADVLRRGMSGKYRSKKEFQEVRAKFKSNCLERGEPEAIVDEVWRQIESFAGYAFAKGHSASYAVESYQSLYLKCYFPLEYMVATLNNGGGFYRAETYVHEAKAKGAIVVPPCINNGFIDTTISGKTIYLGFQHIDSLEKKTMIKIINARSSRGRFTSYDDFVERVPVSIEQLDLLIRINALRTLGKDKRTLLWEAYYKENTTPKNENQQRFFSVSMQDYILPKFHISQLEDAFDQLELISFPLYDPFILLEKQPETNTCANDLEQYLNKTITIYGYLVTLKNTRTSKGDRMFFGTFLDQAGNWLDTVHFPPIAKKYPFSGKGIYKLTGKLVEEFNFITLEVTIMHRMPYVPDPRFDPTYDRKELSAQAPSYILLK